MSVKDPQCWIGSALSNFKINKRNSIALEKKFMDFSCVEKEVYSVYSKMEEAKQTFLHHTDKKDILNALKECTPSAQEPRMSESVAVRSVKLQNLDRDFAYKKELLERKREIHLNNLKSTLLAANRHVAADNELPSHHETQMATTLSGNPIEAQRNVVDANVANVREGDGANDMEPTCSHTSDRRMGDATVSIELVGKSPAQQQDDMEIDVAGRFDSVGLGENAIGGSSSPKDVGDHNDSCGSSTLPSTASDHSMPTILEIQSVSLQQVLHSGTQNQEKQADLNPMPENDEEDPLQAEIKQLRLENDDFIKSHKENKQRLKSECAKEITEMIAQIRLKYNAKDQEADTVFNCKEKESRLN
nr:hypothetical protein [Tanacetum cinerariifolium]